MNYYALVECNFMNFQVGFEIIMALTSRVDKRYILYESRSGKLSVCKKLLLK